MRDRRRRAGAVHMLAGLGRHDQHDAPTHRSAGCHHVDGVWAVLPVQGSLFSRCYLFRAAFSACVCRASGRHHVASNSEPKFGLGKKLKSQRTVTHLFCSADVKTASTVTARSARALIGTGLQHERCQQQFPSAAAASRERCGCIKGAGTKGKAGSHSACAKEPRLTPTARA